MTSWSLPYYSTDGAFCAMYRSKRSMNTGSVLNQSNSINEYKSGHLLCEPPGTMCYVPNRRWWFIFYRKCSLSLLPTTHRSRFLPHVVGLHMESWFHWLKRQRLHSIYTSALVFPHAQGPKSEQLENAERQLYWYYFVSAGFHFAKD